MNGNGLPASNGTGLLLESHEDRLQGLEVAQNRTAAEVAVCSTRVELLGHQMEKGHHELREQLQDGVHSILEQVKATNAKVETIGSQVGVNTKELDKLKATDRVRVGRHRKFRSLFWGLLLTVAGALGTKAVESLWDRFLHH